MTYSGAFPIPNALEDHMQEQVQKQKSTRPEDVEEAPAKSGSRVADEAADTLENIEDVLDAQLDEELLADMDDVLEENAQEFVANYIQGGGE